MVWLVVFAGLWSVFAFAERAALRERGWPVRKEFGAEVVRVVEPSLATWVTQSLESSGKTAAPESRCAKAGKSDCANAMRTRNEGGSSKAIFVAPSRTASTSRSASHPAQESLGHEPMHVNHSGPRALRARLDASPGRACYNLEAQSIETRRCPAQAECNSASTRDVDAQVASTAADSFLPARALGYIYDAEETARETARDVQVQVLTRGEYRFMKLI
jgi:hypothetical protein